MKIIKHYLKLILLPACLVVLSACGGSGGNGSRANTSTPELPYIISSASVAYTSQAVNFSASLSVPGNLPLTYSWDFGDGAGGVGLTTSHAYSTMGAHTVTLTATNNSGQSFVSTSSIQVYGQPTVPTITPSTSSASAGQSINFTGSSTDPNGLALTYSWSFGDGATGTGATTAHTYSASGLYTVTLTASDSAGMSSSSTTSIQVYASPGTPTIASSPGPVYINQSVTFTGTVADPNNRLVSYVWDFGDGATGTGLSASHTYTADGTFTVTFTVTDVGGISASNTYSQFISWPTDNYFGPDCSGTNCSATRSTLYSGSGTGVWRYNNTTGSDATVNINISGVSAGKTVTMLFSNGGSNAASGTPVTGVLATPVVPTPQIKSLTAPGNDPDVHQQYDSNHQKMLIENLKLASALNTSRSSTRSAARYLPPPPPMPTPVVGSTRSWNESAFDKANYTATVKAVCSVPSGRNVVIWADSSYDGINVTASDITAFTTAYCGSSGGYAKLAALLGDAWGTVSAGQSPMLISDTPTKQDINIVIVASATNQYAGYFWAQNNYLASTYIDSNEALAFFVNGNGLHNNIKYYASVLLHESTHMINFYQRSVVRSVSHDTWLEETSAMMTEDIVTPAVLGGYDTMVTTRVPKYVKTGGAIDYTNWPSLASDNYALGGAFGAYLNRRYGIAIYQQLITDCTAALSYTCLDTLIKKNNGPGFAMDFARFGASIFAELPAAGIPDAYGYPTKSSGGYILSAINVPATAPATATALASGFTATTHTYNIDVVAPGHTSYVRTGVVVPANTTLIVVVQ